MKSAHLLDSGRRLPALAALSAFERAAAHLSFQRAARELALTPSAVSHQIRGLEEMFGVRLFIRGGGAVRLTPAGERYLRSVAPALAQLEEAGRDLLGQGGDRSELRVSALPFFTSTVILPALSEFRRLNPGIVVRLETTHQYADFDGAGVDVAIRFGRDRSAGLRLEPLLDVRSQPVCAPALAQGGLTRPEQLGGQVLIHVAAQPGAWPGWLRQNDLPEDLRGGDLWVDSIPAALEAAEQGLGVALAMHPLIRARPRFGEALVAPFGEPGRRYGTFYMVVRPEQAQERRIEAFRRWLAGAVRRVESM